MYFDTDYPVKKVPTVFDAELAISAIYHPSCQKCNDKQHLHEVLELRPRHTRLATVISIGRKAA